MRVRVLICVSVCLVCVSVMAEVIMSKICIYYTGYCCNTSHILNCHLCCARELWKVLMVVPFS